MHLGHIRVIKYYIRNYKVFHRRISEFLCSFSRCICSFFKIRFRANVIPTSRYFARWRINWISFVSFIAKFEKLHFEMQACVYIIANVNSQWFLRLFSFFTKAIGRFVKLCPWNAIKIQRATLLSETNQNRSLILC